jgi:hypothetical protein
MEPKPRATKKPKPSPRTISGQLRQAVQESGLSAYRLAADSGLNVAAVLRFKSGERSLSLESADRLAAPLGLELRSRK